MNSANLVGNVGKDPETLITDSGTKIVNFSLATRGWGKDAESDWHRIVAFGKTADVVEQYVRKGSKLAIQGRIQVRGWEDQEGNKRTSVKIVASQVELLDKREVQSGYEKIDISEAANRMPSLEDDLGDEIIF